MNRVERHIIIKDKQIDNICFLSKNLYNYANYLIRQEFNSNHVSKFVINYSIKHKIGTIIIGNNKDWKREINIGRVNNQKFVSVPFNKLISQIQYKAEEQGINVILTEESYTSKVDHLAFETLEYHNNYLGKRVKRGLFQSSVSKLINADVNGAIGIARKVIGDSFIKKIINRGLVFNPIRINILNNFNKGGC